jgi:hypothetical protein
VLDGDEEGPKLIWSVFFFNLSIFLIPMIGWLDRASR